MVMRGRQPVLQFRGQIRKYMIGAEHYLEVLQRTQARLPDPKPFTVLELQTINDAVIILGAKLAHRVNV